MNVLILQAFFGTPGIPIRVIGKVNKIYLVFIAALLFLEPSQLTRPNSFRRKWNYLCL